MRFLNTILEVFFPSRCVSCGKKDSDICDKCLADAPGAERESEKWIFPIYDYRHPPIKRAIHLLKYKGRKRLANVFAEVMYGMILEELADLSVVENFKNAVLIPIPLSGHRLRERGFNQAELICKRLILLDNSTNLKLEDNVLIKTKETKHQAQIENRQERLQNIVGSFALKKRDVIKNRNIILIDDVTTTGATLREAKKVLRESGARKIIAFTVAH